MVGLRGPRKIRIAGISVTATIKAESTPKLENIPNSKMGTTLVKQNETKPAKVVSAAKKTGGITRDIASTICAE